MKSALALTVISFLLLTVPSMCWAQAEPQMPKPGPEYQRLHYFVGDWQTEYEQKAGPMGPGGKFTQSAPVASHGTPLDTEGSVGRDL